jgi:hypothetical protein
VAVDVERCTVDVVQSGRGRCSCSVQRIACSAGDWTGGDSSSTRQYETLDLSEGPRRVFRVAVKQDVWLERR